MKKILLISLLSLLVYIQGFSQNLSIDSINAELVLPDTVNYNDNLSQILIVNITGGAAYTGQVSLMAAVDSSNGYQSIDTVATRFVQNKLNDTIMFTYNETYNNANGYRVGGHVVVVWPIAATLTTVDTFSTNITVVQVVGVNENKVLYNLITIYPNPSKNYINIKNKSQKFKVKQVRVFDVKGRIIYQDKLYRKIDISNFNKGVYFLNVELEGGKVLHYKIIKSE